MAASPLQLALDTALSERKLQRALISAPEGVGRTRLLNALGALVVPVSEGPLLEQTLWALLSLPGSARSDEEAVLVALSAAPAMQGVEGERALVAVELLASLLGIRRASFRTARLDDDSRREGACLELARWLIDRAQTGVAIIAFDDAHLADDEGVAFLEGLSQREEPVPLVLLVSHDAVPERATAAFRARREAWLTDARWRRVELKAPPLDELLALLTSNGATAEQATAMLVHTGGNPKLALGLWPQVRTGAVLGELPSTLDGLRLFRVKTLGEQVLEACATLAVLGGGVPSAGLSAINPSLPAALDRANTAGLTRVDRDGPLEVCRFVDPRMAGALVTVLPMGQLLGVRLAVGSWAVQALEQVEPSAFARVAQVLVPLAAPALDGQTASLWEEAFAMTRGGRAETATRLEVSVRAAQGVRRLVLLRRMAEVKLFLGLPDEALALIATAGRFAPSPAQPWPEGTVGRVLAQQHRGVLDRWDTLSLDEAQVSLELVRAECVSYLVKKEETQRAFAELEKRLTRLKGAAVPHLWIRWAKGWSWFTCEILGRAAEGMRACALVRRTVSQDVLAADEDAIAFVRAEEIATASIGDLSRAMALTEEHIALADRAGRLRDACLGWNAHGIVHYGQGALGPARKAFERALELARSTGWLRREAITLHNLTLVLTELGELDAAFAAETTYARLSVLMGNHAGKAEAPLVLATVELARGRLKEAEVLLVQARKTSEANGWDMLLAQARALTGRLRLLKYKASGDLLEVTKAKNDLLAAIEVLEEHNLAWTEELDPGEVFAQLALAMKWTGQTPAAKELIAKALTKLPLESVISRAQLDVATALLAGQSVEPALKWFDDRGFIRRGDFWRKL
jgi:tetratricopeptide (TPR) repeat protein